MSKIAYGLAGFLAFVFCLGAANGASQLEFSFWDRNYTGTIAGKQVSVDITRINNDLHGSYCYEPCNQRKMRLILRGSLGLSGCFLRSAHRHFLVNGMLKFHRLR